MFSSASRLLSALAEFLRVLRIISQTDNQKTDEPGSSEDEIHQGVITSRPRMERRGAIHEATNYKF